MADSNTARSKRWLEKQGWTVGGTEQIVRIPPRFPGDRPKMFKRDLFNMFDLVAFNPAEINTKAAEEVVDFYDRNATMIPRAHHIQSIIAKHHIGGIVGVQSTTVSNQAERVTKIQGIPEAEGWLKSGGRIQVHGWKQKGGKGGRWILTVQEIGLDEEFPGTLKSEEKSATDAPLFEG